MKTARARRRWVAVGAAALVAVSACAGEVATPVQGLAVLIRGPQQDISPFQDPNAAFLALIAEGPGIPTQTAQAPAMVQPLVKTGMPLSVPAVPYGPARQIRVEIYPGDANGQPTLPAIGRGRTAPRDVGGPSETFLVSAYVTRTNAWATPLTNAGAETMIDPRIGVAAARLPDGNVLLAGGGSFIDGAKSPFDIASYGALSSSVLSYDADSRELKALSAPPISAVLTVPRAQMASATGPDGQVVFAGGVVMGDLGPKASNLVEYWDPKDAKIKQATSVSPHLKFARSGHSITRLFDTQQYYLIAGGTGPDVYEGTTISIASTTWEIWDPTNGVTAQGKLGKARWNHATVRLPERDGGYIVLIGGEEPNGTIADFEVLRYDNKGNISFQGNTKVTCYCGAETINGPDSNEKCAALVNQPGCSMYSWVPLLRAFEPAIGRTLPGAVFVTTDTTAHIWVVGGFADVQKTQPLSRIDVFDVVNGGIWLSGTPALEAPRGAPLVDATVAGAERARVLVSGGVDASGATVGLGEVLAYEVDATGARVRRENAEGSTPGGGRVLGQAIALRTGHVLVVGGAVSTGGGFSASPTLGLYNPR